MPVGQSTLQRDIPGIKVQSVQPGIMAPDFEAATLDGTPFKLSDLRGKLVLVDFWATWCGPCVAELPNIKKALEKYGVDGLNVVGISFDREAGTARRFAADKKLTWPQVWAEKADEGPLANLYGVGGIPATFLIGPDGKVVARDLRGPELAKTVARELKKMKKSPAAPASFLAGIASALKTLAPQVANLQPEEEAAVPADSPAALEALEATAARYRSLKTYRDTFHYEARATHKDETEPQVGYLEGTLAFAAPHRLASKSDTLEIYYDGLHLTRYTPSPGQYSVVTGADSLRRLETDDSASPTAPTPEIHPLATLLAMRELPAKEALGIISVNGLDPETRNGRAGQRLSGTLRLAPALAQKPVPFTAFINAQTQLFEEFRLDVTAAARQAAQADDAADEADIERAEVVLSLADVQVDADIEAAAFAFKPGGARKVDALMGSPFPPIRHPLDLLGQAAPALAGTTLDGRELDLASQRGKPVIVAFWGTWAPETPRLLSDLQYLTQTTTEEPAAVIGVNRNAPAARAAVQRDVASAHATFPQLLAAEDDVAELWHVSVLPAVFLVDREGVIAEAYGTWPSDAREKVGRQLDCLRKAEPLYTGDELAARRAQAGDADQAGGQRLQDSGTALADERLEVGESQPVRGARYNMSEQDVDGDGALELILPDWSGGISIVKPATGEVRQVKLRGLQQVSLLSVRGVPIDGQTCWLCAGMTYGMGRGTRLQPPRQSVLIRLYSPTGEILWTFSPQVPEGADAQACATAADLDGDGAPEYAIGLTTYVRQPMGENSWTTADMHGRLIVLDHSGQMIAQRDLDGQIELLYAAASPPGQATPLLCISNGELELYTVRPSREAKEARP